MTRQDLSIRITADASGVQAGVNQATQSLGTLEQSAKNVGTNIAGYLAGTITVGAFVTKLVDVQRQFDVLNSSLITVTGSSANAAREFAWIKEFAATTPYSLAEVTNAFVKMKALGLDASEASLRSYGNTASAMGKSLEQMIEAVADASTGEFERLKEFGIKASKEGENVALTFQGVTKSIGNNAAEITQYLSEIGNNQFAAAMAERAKTLDGAISNLSDTWDQLFLTISQNNAGGLIHDSVKLASGAISDAIDILNAMNAATTENARQTGAAATIQEGLAIAFEAIAVLGVNTAYTLKAIGTEIGGIAAQAAALARLDWSGAAYIGQEMKKDAEAARAAVDAQSTAILNARANATELRDVMASARSGTLEYSAAVMKLTEMYNAGRLPAKGLESAIAAIQPAAKATAAAVADTGAAFEKFSAKYATGTAEIMRKKKEAEADFLRTIGGTFIPDNPQHTAALQDLIGYYNKLDGTAKASAKAQKDAAREAAQEVKAAAKLEEDARRQVMKLLDEELELLARREEEIAKAYRAAESELDGIREQLEAREYENSLIGKTADEIADLNRQRKLAQAALKDEAAAAIRLLDPSSELVKVYEDQAEALRKLADAEYEGATRAETERARVEAARETQREWERTSQAIENALTDALMRGFENGKGFGESLADSIEALFKTMVLRPIVSAVVSPIANTITGALGFGAPGAAGQGGSIFDLLSAGSSVYNATNTIVGASVASLAAANAVGMAGGDALGTMIAGNAANWGVSASGVSGAASTMGTIAAAAPYILAGAAVLSALGAFDGPTPHMGGAARVTRSGQYTRATNTNTAGFGLDWGAYRDNADRSADMDKAVQAVTTGLVTSLDKAMDALDLTKNFEIVAKFAADGKDASVGALRVLDEAGKVIADYSGKFDKEAAKGIEQLGNASGQVLRDALLQMDIPAWAAGVLNDLGATPTVTQFEEAVTKIATINGVIETTGDALGSTADALASFLSSSDIAVTQQVQALFDATTSGYELAMRSVTKSTAPFADVAAKIGQAVPPSYDAIRELIDGLDLTTAAGKDAARSLLGLVPAVQAAQDAALAVFGIGRDTITGLIQGVLEGKATAAAAGEDFGQAITEGLQRAISAAGAQAIADVFIGQIIQPIVTQMIAGKTIAEALASGDVQAGIETAVTTAQAWGEIASNPEFKAAIQPITSLFTEVMKGGEQSGVASKELSKLSESTTTLTDSTVDMTSAAEKADAKLNELIDTLNSIGTINIKREADKVTVGVPAAQKAGLQGFATGGFTGVGGKYEPAGIVHRGEVVFSQEDVARLGGVSVVEAIRTGAMRGYSNGGVVTKAGSKPFTPRDAYNPNPSETDIPWAWQSAASNAQSAVQSVIDSIVKGISDASRAIDALFQTDYENALDDIQYRAEEFRRQIVEARQRDAGASSTSASTPPPVWVKGAEVYSIYPNQRRPWDDGPNVYEPLQWLKSGTKYSETKDFSSAASNPFASGNADLFSSRFDKFNALLIKSNDIGEQLQAYYDDMNTQGFVTKETGEILKRLSMDVTGYITLLGNATNVAKYAAGDTQSADVVLSELEKSIQEFTAFLESGALHVPGSPASPTATGTGSSDIDALVNEFVAKEEELLRKRNEIAAQELLEPLQIDIDRLGWGDLQRSLAGIGDQTEDYIEQLKNLGQLTDENREAVERWSEAMRRNTATTQIEDMYRSQLGRAADEEGLQYWLEQALAGIDIESAFSDAATTENLKLRLLELTDAEAGLAQQRERELSLLSETNQALQQRIYDLEDARTATDKAMTALKRSIDAEAKRITEDAAAQVNALNAQIDAQQDAISSSQELARTLDSMSRAATDAVRKLRNEIDTTATMSLTEGRAYIDMALSLVSAGGQPDEQKLAEAINAVTADDANRYATKEDYDRAQLRQAAKLELIAAGLDDQKSVAERALDEAERQTKLLREQIDAVNKAKDAQIKALNDQLETFQKQIDAINGVDNSVKTVEVATRDVEKAIRDLTGALTTAQALSKPGGGGGATPSEYTPTTGSPPPPTTGSPPPLDEWKKQLLDENTATYIADNFKTSSQELIDTLQAGSTGYNIFITADSALEALNATSNSDLTLRGVVQKELTLNPDSPLTMADRTDYAYGRISPEELLDKYGIASFASGGLHAGGLRLVGENGPELEVTGPARIWNFEQTRQLLAGAGRDDETAALLDEIRALRAEVAELRAANVATARATSDTARILNRTTNGGNAMMVESIA